MAYKFDKNAFVLPKNKSKIDPEKMRGAKAEVMRFLFAVKPQVVKDIIRLQGIAIKDELEFEDFIKLYKSDKIDFDADKFLSQIKVNPKDILEAKKRFQQN